MERLDLSSNEKLIKMIFTTCSVDELILPSSNQISDIIMDDFKIDNIDQVIDNIYNNAVAKPITEGRFYLKLSKAPSSNSMEKLQILADTYMWHITVK